MRNFNIFISLLLGAATFGRELKSKGKWPTYSGEPTFLNAHRGETVLVPENTLESTSLAAILEADHIEFDLHLTKDGQIVVYHDLTLKAGSNVASLPQFAHKMRNYTGIVDEGGNPITIRNNWIIDDFTLDEIRELGVHQRVAGIRPTLFNGLLHIPTFQEFLSQVHHSAHGLNKSIGLVLELKQPMFHNQYYNSSNPRFMEDRILDILFAYGYPLTNTSEPNCISDQDNNAPVQCGHLIIQSFELSSMEYIHSRVPYVEKSMLINSMKLPLLTYKGLEQLSTWISYFSPWKELLYTGILAEIEKEGIEYDKDLIESLGGFIPPREIVREAHSLGVKVFIYTVYDSREPSRRGCTVSCDPEDKKGELFYYFDLGVDGVFGENMMENREIRLMYQYERVNNVTATTTIA
jgi:glycerophosphoryl diester phosphodiesterase